MENPDFTKLWDDANKKSECTVCIALKYYEKDIKEEYKILPSICTNSNLSCGGWLLTNISGGSS